MIVCNCSIERTDVELVIIERITCLNKILHQHFHAHNKVLETLDFLNAGDESPHLALAFGQFDLSYLRPELFCLNTGIRVNPHITLHTLEYLIRYWSEGMVGEPCCTHNMRLAELLSYRNLNKHIIANNH